MTKPFKHIMLAATIALTGAAFSGSAYAGAADDAIADAKEAQKQAQSVGGQWRDTGKMIKQAEKLLKEGKTGEAEKLAREAEAQGMLGYMQATSQTMDNLHIN
jgi:hypothetical protein